MLNTNVLVLNRSYLPIHVTSVRRAFSLIYQGGARAVNTRYETFENIEFWYSSLMREAKEEIPIIFFANKVDLLDEASWSRDDIITEFRHYNAASFITSAKTGEGVADGFFEIGRAVIEKEL